MLNFEDSESCISKLKPLISSLGPEGFYAQFCALLFNKMALPAAGQPRKELQFIGLPLSVRERCFQQGILSACLKSPCTGDQQTHTNPNPFRIYTVCSISPELAQQFVADQAVLLQSFCLLRAFLVCFAPASTPWHSGEINQVGFWSSVLWVALRGTRNWWGGGDRNWTCTSPESGLHPRHTRFAWPDPAQGWKCHSP